MKSSDRIIKKFLNRIFTTASLKAVSDTLEELAQNSNFKNHANDILTDNTLTSSQKKNQLMYLLKATNVPTLYEFFEDELTADNLWIFSSDKHNYFDNFVQKFQLATENTGVVYLVTAVELEPRILQIIAHDLSGSFGYKVLLNHQVNPAIIGGAQVRVENLIFDYSLRSKFRHFQRQWLSTLEKDNKLVGRHSI